MVMLVNELAFDCSEDAGIRIISTLFTRSCVFKLAS